MASHDSIIVDLVGEIVAGMGPILFMTSHMYRQGGFRLSRFWADSTLECILVCRGLLA